LLTNICITVFDYDPYGFPPYAFPGNLPIMKRGNSAVDYSWTSNDFNKFDVLRQVMKMDETGHADRRRELSWPGKNSSAGVLF